MKRARKVHVRAADLFCGAGGTSTGLLMACNDLDMELELLAINHWNVAIETHKANHPYAQHLCESADNVDPRKAVPSGRLKIFVASPECTHHSNARGGRPMSDQSRASAWHVLRWAEALYIDSIIVENVKEFRSWGPLGANGRPIKRLKGQLYLQFLSSLRALGYKVEDRVLNCADFGDPTTRERLFIIARRGKAIRWPQPTHCDPAKLARRSEHLFGQAKLKPWVPARDIIDWALPSQSIFSRKKPLARKTLERIYAGFQKFNSPEAAEPYLIVLRQHMGARSLDQPIPTLSAGGQHVGLCEPFVLSHPRPKENGADSLEKPLRTVTATSSDFALVQPHIVNMKGKSDARSVDAPLPTQTTRQHLYVAEPEAFILPHRMFDQGAPDSIDKPLRTIVGKNGRQVRICEPVLIDIDHTGGNGDSSRPVTRPISTQTTKARTALVESFLVDINHGIKPEECPVAEAQRRVQSVDMPLGTVTTSRGKGVVEAESFIVPNFGERDGQQPRSHSVDEPLPTVTSHGAGMVVEAIAEPFITKYYGAGDGATSTQAPIPTVTTKDRFALVTTERGTFAIDIRLRMLKTHELAAAHSVGNYILKGKSEEQVKQIGNMVPAMTARALCREVLSS